MGTKGARASSCIIKWVNLLTLFVSLCIIATGIWLSQNHGDCEKFLMLPVVVIGASAFLMFVVTTGGAAHVVTANFSGTMLWFKEYHIRDYSQLVQHALNNTKNWMHIRDCFLEDGYCNGITQEFHSFTDLASGENPLQSGCCRPPIECGFHMISVTTYDVSTQHMMAMASTPFETLPTFNTLSNSTPCNPPSNPATAPILNTLGTQINKVDDPTIIPLAQISMNSPSHQVTAVTATSSRHAQTFKTKNNRSSTLPNLVSAAQAPPGALHPVIKSTISTMDTAPPPPPSTPDPPPPTTPSTPPPPPPSTPDPPPPTTPSTPPPPPPSNPDPPPPTTPSTPPPPPPSTPDPPPPTTPSTPPPPPPSTPHPPPPTTPTTLSPPPPSTPTIATTQSTYVYQSDCLLYSNDPGTKCFSCLSCKAGVAQYFRKGRLLVTIINITVFIVLLALFTLGCCARLHASQAQYTKMKKKVLEDIMQEKMPFCSECCKCGRYWPPCLRCCCCSKGEGDPEELASPKSGLSRISGCCAGEDEQTNGWGCSPCSSCCKRRKGKGKKPDIVCCGPENLSVEELGPSKVFDTRKGDHDEVAYRREDELTILDYLEAGWPVVRRRPGCFSCACCRRKRKPPDTKQKGKARSPCYPSPCSPNRKEKGIDPVQSEDLSLAGTSSGTLVWDKPPPSYKHDLSKKKDQAEMMGSKGAQKNHEMYTNTLFEGEVAPSRAATSHQEQSRRGPAQFGKYPGGNQESSPTAVSLYLENQNLPGPPDDEDTDSDSDVRAGWVRFAEPQVLDRRFQFKNNDLDLFQNKERKLQKVEEDVTRLGMIHNKLGILQQQLLQKEQLLVLEDKIREQGQLERKKEELALEKEHLEVLRHKLEEKGHLERKKELSVEKEQIELLRQALNEKGQLEKRREALAVEKEHLELLREKEREQLEKRKEELAVEKEHLELLREKEREQLEKRKEELALEKEHVGILREKLSQAEQGQLQTKKDELALELEKLKEELAYEKEQLDTLREKIHAKEKGQLEKKKEELALEKEELKALHGKQEKVNYREKGQLEKKKEELAIEKEELQALREKLSFKEKVLLEKKKEELALEKEQLGLFQETLKEKWELEKKKGELAIEKEKFRMLQEGQKDKSLSENRQLEKKPAQSKINNVAAAGSLSKLEEGNEDGEWEWESYYSDDSDDSNYSYYSEDTFEEKKTPKQIDRDLPAEDPVYPGDSFKEVLPEKRSKEAKPGEIHVSQPKEELFDIDNMRPLEDPLFSMGKKNEKVDKAKWEPESPGKTGKPENFAEIQDTKFPVGKQEQDEWRPLEDTELSVGKQKQDDWRPGSRARQIVEYRFDPPGKLNKTFQLKAEESDRFGIEGNDRRVEESDADYKSPQQIQTWQMEANKGEFHETQKQSQTAKQARPIKDLVADQGRVPEKNKKSTLPEKAVDVGQVKRRAERQSRQSISYNFDPPRKRDELEPLQKKHKKSDILSFEPPANRLPLGPSSGGEVFSFVPPKRISLSLRDNTYLKFEKSKEIREQNKRAIEHLATDLKARLEKTKEPSVRIGVTSTDLRAGLEKKKEPSVRIGVTSTNPTTKKTGMRARICFDPVPNTKKEKKEIDEKLKELELVDLKKRLAEKRKLLSELEKAETSKSRNPKSP